MRMQMCARGEQEETVKEMEKRNKRADWRFEDRKYSRLSTIDERHGFHIHANLILVL